MVQVNVQVNNHICHPCRGAWKGVQVHAKKAAWTVGDSESLGYAVKAAKSVMDIAIPVLRELSASVKVIAGLADLTGHLSGFGAFLGSLKVVQRGKEWIDPSTRRQLFADGWEAVASRVALTVGQAMDTVKYLESVSLFNLGQVSSYQVGNVPVYNLVKDSIFIFACSLGAVGDRRKINAADVKKEKWEKMADSDDDALRAYYQNKLDSASEAELEAKADRWEKRIDNVQHLRDYKKTKYSHEKTKGWVSMAANISKVAIITLGLAAVALGVQGVLTVGLVLAGVSFTVNAIGLGKKLFNQFHDPVPAQRMLVNA